MANATPEQLVRIAIGVVKPYVKKQLLSKLVLERDAAIAELAAEIVKSIEAQYEFVAKPDKSNGPGLHH